jgi:dTDP-4-amino-4,6-dideoxygalactose transaminase
MIPQIDLTRQHTVLRDELMAAVERVLASGRFILGPEGRALETEVAALCGVRHGVGVASGSDALRLALTALGVGPGDEVITAAFSFVATASPILHVGATPVFVDIEMDTFALDPEEVSKAVTPRTRAIIPVHLFGHPAPMSAIMEIARRRRLAVIEDAAQAIGARDGGRLVGSFGDLACLSFYPTKNLGACGDAGMVVTDREDLADRLRLLRDHGSNERYHHVALGWNSRLDEIQAAILRVKLRYLPGWIERRREIARRYDAALSELPLIRPSAREHARHVYHHYTIRTPSRDALAKALADLGVGTTTHYPLPIPGQPLFRDLRVSENDVRRAWQAAREVLSLPCFPELTDEEVETVAHAVRECMERIG